jgi:hypothetical protein
MTVKRDDKRDGVVPACVAHGLPDDLLMAEVYAVKETNGKTDFAAWRIQFSRGIDYRHLA